MQHYICTGECGGESPTAGVCQMESCSKHGEHLTECNCEDGLHKNILEDKEMMIPDGEELSEEE